MFNLPIAANIGTTKSNFVQKDKDKLMTNEQLTNINLNTCDIKIEANSRSYNVSVHCYEYATKEKIDTVIDNAIYGLLETQRRIKLEIIQEKEVAGK